MTQNPAKLLARLAALGFLSAVSAAISACNSAPAGSCDWRPQGGNRCFEYSSDEAAKAKEGCTGGRKWSDQACTVTGSIGGCKTTSGVTKWLFPGEKITDRASAGTECMEWIEPRK